YHLSDQIFVHTEKMRHELIDAFGVRPDKVVVIPYGINNAVPDSGLESVEAKRQLGIAEGERTILFFGRIAAYKGLDYLIAALERLLAHDASYRLIIAGQIKEGAAGYWNAIRDELKRSIAPDRVVIDIREIPDEKTECYFKAADVLVLPYRQIFQ